MKLYVCIQCDKAKKKKVVGQTRITGQETFDQLEVWLASEELGEKIQIQPVRCLDECEKGPVALLKPEKKLFKRLTVEKLQKVKSRLKDAVHEGDPSLNRDIFHQ